MIGDPGGMDIAELSNRFRYHPPTTSERITLHGEVRTLVSELAMHLNELLPEGREKSVVMTKLEETMFWANAAVARVPDVPGGSMTAR